MQNKDDQNQIKRRTFIKYFGTGVAGIVASAYGLTNVGLVQANEGPCVDVECRYDTSWQQCLNGELYSCSRFKCYSKRTGIYCGYYDNCHKTGGSC